MHGTNCSLRGSAAGTDAKAGKTLLCEIERADSIGLDAHKWFFPPYEAGRLLTKDARTLENAFAIRHDVLQDTVWGKNHPNFSDRGLQLSRSVRALEVLMSVQTFGMVAFRRAVSCGMELAARTEEHVRASRYLEPLSHASLGIVCFRVNLVDTDISDEAREEINRTVLACIFRDDRAFISSTLLRGTCSLRMCNINHTTTWDDVRETLESVERFGKEALSGAAP